MLHRGMANLQHEVDSADFAPQTKVYLAWLNDLNGNRFGLKITDAADKTLLRHTQFLDDAVKELAYADAPASTHRPELQFYQARQQPTFIQQWAQHELQALPEDFRFRIAPKLDKAATHETTKLRMQL